MQSIDNQVNISFIDSALKIISKKLSEWEKYKPK